MRSKGISLLLFALTSVVGCARGNVELLETRLRMQEDEVLQLQQSIAERDRRIGELERERRLLQTQLAESSEPKLLPEATRSIARIVSLKIEPTLTGLLDQQQPEGNDTLNVLLGPTDDRDEIVRQEGALELELLDVTRPPGERRLGIWNFTQEEVAQAWHDGFLASGFQFSLPLNLSAIPSALTISARWTTPDGRRFDHAVVIRTVGNRTELVESPLPLPQVSSEPLTAPFPKQAEPAPRRIEQVEFTEPADSEPEMKVIPLDSLIGP